MSSAFSSVGADVELVVQNRAAAIEDVEVSIFDYYGVDRRFYITKAFCPERIRGRSYFYSLASALIAWRKKPSLVYCRNLTAAFFSVVFGLPVYFESHAPVESGGRLSEQLFRFMIRRKKFLKLVVITASLENYYLKRFPELRGKTYVAPDGADIDDRVTYVTKTVRNAVLNIGYVGHLYQGKGVEVVVALAERMPEHNFHIVGGFDEDIDYWSKKAQGLSNLRFHGYKAPSEVALYLEKFNVVLLPNQRKVSVHGGGDIAEWTSPLKMFEYMASRTAIVASDLPVLKEVLVHEHNALLCDPEDIASWVEAVADLSVNHRKRDKIATQAWSDLNEKYSWKVRAKGIIDDFLFSQQKNNL